MRLKRHPQGNAIATPLSSPCAPPTDRGRAAICAESNRRRAKRAGRARATPSPTLHGGKGKVCGVAMTAKMSRATGLAAVMTAPRHTELREMPLPEIGADAGLLRVVACDICGSDWGKYTSNQFVPCILGHEIVGYVEKLGPIARARWGVKEGDYVALEEYLPCGHCEYCRTS